MLTEFKVVWLPYLISSILLVLRLKQFIKKLGFRSQRYSECYKFVAARNDFLDVRKGVFRLGIDWLTTPAR